MTNKFQESASDFVIVFLRIASSRSRSIPIEENFDHILPAHSLKHSHIDPRRLWGLKIIATQTISNQFASNGVFHSDP